MSGHSVSATRGSAVLLMVCVVLVAPAARADDDPHNAAVRRALELLPRRPERVVLLDYDKASPAMREKLSRVEGFVTTGEPTVYLKKQGAALQQAARGPGFFDYVVAIKIWHEMAHIDGAEEREAQRHEEELWKEFIVSQKVDARRGLAYLDLLRKRRGAARADRDREQAQVDPGPNAGRGPRAESPHEVQKYYSVPVRRAVIVPV